jgi:hypothetical protein
MAQETKTSTILLVVALVAVIAYYFKDKISELLGANGVDFLNEPPSNLDAPIKEPKSTGGGESKPKTTPKQTPKSGNKLFPININTANYNLRLQKGSFGNEVAILQTMLNKYVKMKGLSLLIADGDFGNKTAEALEKISGFTNNITLKEALEYEKNLFK